MHIEPEGGQVGEDGSEGQSIGKESWNVFHEHVAGSYCANGVEHPGPAPAFVSHAEPFAGVGEGLTGETTCDQFNGRVSAVSPPLRGGSYVVMFRYFRPVFVEDAAAVRVEFNLAGAGESGSVEAEIDTSHA